MSTNARISNMWVGLARGMGTVPFVRRGTAITFCAAAILAGALTGCNDQHSAAYTRVLEARRLTTEILARFTKAADAANRSVMADTDEASIAFAQEAESEKRGVQGDIDSLETIIQGLDDADEAALLKKFRESFVKYQALDREVLELAVENTNLKAQKLSFGPAHEAVKAFRDSLDAIMNNVPEQNLWHVRALAATAILAVREIEVLQGPHIAASEDAVMIALEKQMATSEADARNALTELKGMGMPEVQPGIDGANTALTRFMDINTQLVALSRRNSNVRSLALSLGEKLTLTAACETSLRDLGNHLAKRSLSGTR